MGSHNQINNNSEEQRKKCIKQTMFTGPNKTTKSLCGNQPDLMSKCIYFTRWQFHINLYDLISTKTHKSDNLQGKNDKILKKKEKVN